MTRMMRPNYHWTFCGFSENVHMYGRRVAWVNVYCAMMCGPNSVKIFECLTCGHVLGYKFYVYFTAIFY